MLPVPEKQQAAWHCLQPLPAVPTACITGALSGFSCMHERQEGCSRHSRLCMHGQHHLPAVRYWAGTMALGGLAALDRHCPAQDSREGLCRACPAGAWLHLAPNLEGARGLSSPAVRGGTSASAGPSGYELVDPQRQVSTCSVEVDAPWRSIQVQRGTPTLLFLLCWELHVV